MMMLRRHLSLAVATRCRALSTAGTHAEVPVIDFSAFLNGDAAAKEEVSDQLFHAFRDIGFVTLGAYSVLLERRGWIALADVIAYLTRSLILHIVQ
jgi:hypothetical protein